MDDSSDRQWPDQQRSPLLKRILHESRLEGQKHRRKPQQKHYRAPNFPGTAAFDLKNGLSEMPYAKRNRERACRRTAPLQSPLPPAHSGHKPALSEEELLNMNLDEYHATIFQELDSIEEASRSNTLSPLPYLSANNIFEDSSESLSEDVADVSSYFETFYPGVPSELTSAILADVTDYSLDMPITKQQLIKEVRSLYGDLASVENECSEIVDRQSKSSEGLDDQQWKALITRHSTLLQDHHDFFQASQHPSAPPALKLLATKYAMPKHVWHRSMHQFLELLRRHSHNSEQNIILFGNLCIETMEKFTENIPQLSHEWDLIKDNLQEYFTALRTDGFNVPLSLINHWDKGETAWTMWRKTYFPPMHGHFFGDDNLDWFIKTYLSDGFWDSPVSQEELDDRDFSGNSLQDMAQLIMTGWLQYGRKIATSYHVFCQVAIFLATTISVASLTLQ